MARLNQALDACSNYCCDVNTANHEELPTGTEGHPFGERQYSHPTSPKLSSLGSWSNDGRSLPSSPSPSFYREMESRFANDDISMGTEITAGETDMNDTMMDTSLAEWNRTGEDVEMVYDSPSRSTMVVSEQTDGTIQITEHGDYSDFAPPSDIESARLTSCKNITNDGCAIGHQIKNQGIIPSSTDVLLGRGGMTNKHPGNIRFRDLVNGRKKEYKAIPRHRYKLKTQFAENVMRQVHAYGGRFLERVNDKSDSDWVVATDTAARKKCSQRLRE